MRMMGLSMISVGRKASFREEIHVLRADSCVDNKTLVKGVQPHFDIALVCKSASARLEFGWSGLACLRGLPLM